MDSLQSAIISYVTLLLNHDVYVELLLQTHSGEHLPYATANMDVKARGFWGIPQQCAYFDVRVFNPNAVSHRDLKLATCYRNCEGVKRRA